MKKFYSILLVAALFFTSGELLSQKFGYVDTANLLAQIPDVKEANSNIETFTAQFQKKGQDMIKALQAKYVELEQKQKTGSISPQQLEQEAQILKQEEAAIIKFEQDSQQKILKKQDDLMTPLREKIQKAISDVATENGYDYIFDLSTGVVLYADEGTDVSPLVKSKLNL